MKIYRFRQPDGAIVTAHEKTDGTFERVEGGPEEGFRPTGDAVAPGTLLAPVVPTQIFCIGLNYRRHAEETGAEVPSHPVVFMKSLNTVCGPGDPIEIPVHQPSKRVDYEVELAVVIGRGGKNIAPADAPAHVAGYTIGHDVSARDWQKWGGGGQWVYGKSFDTFCPLGPALVTPDEIPDPQALGLKTEVNGEVLQQSSTADMIFPVAALVSFLSGGHTLLPGTVILTGTPEGVGMGRDPMRFLQDGDSVSMTIDGIGTLTNPVRSEA